MRNELVSFIKKSKIETAENNQKIKANEEQLKVKLGAEEESKIYAEMKRFALYTDFKALYKKVLPSIKNFED